jgi:hypothetical protein
LEEYRVNKKGQFSIIAALFVAVILIATVIVTYSTIRNSPIQEQPQVLSAIDETNMALKQILGFTIGYYGSVLQVTGNSSYAKMLATNYLQSGLVNIANMHADWAASFDKSTIYLRAYWFTNSSYSMGNLAINYSLTGLGIYGITYATSCKLAVQVKQTTLSNQTQLIVTKDEDEPLINLGKQNFKFYRYIYASSTWELINPSIEPTAYANGTYIITIPSGVDPYSYLIQVEDPRGIIVAASSFSRYTCTLAWNSTLYAASDATIVVELLQNGKMRWLGQNIQLTTQAKPIPPIPVKAIHVNQTINGINREVPFQIEDWTSDYKIPLGLTNNASVFNNKNMLVFLITSKVSKVTIWWDGSDTAIQTPNAYINKYFTMTSTTYSRTLNNTILSLKVDWSDGTIRAISSMKSVTTTAVLMRINTKIARWGNSAPAIVIQNGPVRAVLHHEVEWGPNSDYQIPNCPNFYAHIVLTLPANATYYTYQLRLMFVESPQSRTISDLCPIKITTTISSPQTQTENGISGGFPIVQSGTGTFYNSSSVWQHHWSQIISGTKGAGIMFTDEANKMLYTFDTSASKTGALTVGTQTIELLPITRSAVSLTSAKDLTWYGAVATFDGTPIYDSSNQSGLWITVEYPPTITVTTQS